jgi:hypothetical protein
MAASMSSCSRGTCTLDGCKRGRLPPASIEQFTIRSYPIRVAGCAVFSDLQEALGKPEGQLRVHASPEKPSGDNIDEVLRGFRRCARWRHVNCVDPRGWCLVEQKSRCCLSVAMKSEG